MHTMKGGALLSQGGYGCVFHPEINCQGFDTKNKKFVSKIQKDDFSARNEILIGEDILKASKTQEEKNSFAPVITHCPINISKIKTKGIDDCSIITRKESANYIMVKIKYVNGGVLDTFITSNQSDPLILSLFVSNYIRLLRSIQFLIRNKIIQFDLKGQNIIYNKEKEIPVLIDFGLSIPLERLEKTGEYYHYFYVYAPEYYVWPIEVHFFNFLENVSQNPTANDIRSLINRYVDNNAALQTLSPRFRSEYKKIGIQFLNSFLSMPVPEIKKKILSYWKTWDNYSLSILYLKFLYILFGSSGMIDNNTYIIKFAQILLMNIHPNPERRINIDKNIVYMEKIPYQANIDQLAVFDELIKTIEGNKATIVAKAGDNSRHMAQLTKRVLFTH